MWSGSPCIIWCHGRVAATTDRRRDCVRRATVRYTRCFR
ncbi:hypothetical protein GBAR_LOCUS31630 [Geodia barretti]|uniref:Uncharacterized protein n=1 Tax=Geodia barretti TaxID=519541 RepID=A0AA35U2B1_GEOBA|nr:hypothetical protein GBAR_LOCUS31630 [Geodia barretti]